MSSFGIRLLMGCVGIAVIAVYAALAGVLFYGLLLVWNARPDLWTTLLIVGGGTVLVAVVSYRFGTAQVLAGLDADLIPREKAPGLYQRLDALVAKMDVETPVLAVAGLGSPNAFAIEGDHGIIVLDPLLLSVLDPDEIEALLAHELAHLEGRDAFVQTMAVTVLNTVASIVLIVVLPVMVLVTGIARGIAWIGGRPTGWGGNPGERLRRWVVYAVLTGLVGLTMVVFAHSRRREVAADDRAVAVTGNPTALADALAKIDTVARDAVEIRPLLVRGEEDSWLGQLFATHPPVGDRIERLRNWHRN